MCWGVTSRSEATSAARKTLVWFLRRSTKLICGLLARSIAWLGESPLRLTLFRRLAQGCQTLLVKELFVARMKTQNLSPGDRSTRTEQAPRESRSKFSIRVQELELFRGLAG